MLPGPTNVPNRVMNAMLAPIINHRSDDFRVLYKTIVEKTQKVFQTNGEIILLTTSGTGVVEASVINLIKKGDKAIIPVNGEFGTRLADLIDSWGGQAIRIKARMVKILHLKKSRKPLIKIRMSRQYMQFTMKHLLVPHSDIWIR